MFVVYEGGKPMDFTNFTPSELLSIFYISSNIVCLIVFIYVFIIAKKGLTDHAAGKYFNNILLSHMAYFLLDALWALFAYKIFDNAVIFLVIRIFKHFVISLSAYFWFEYISIKMGSDLINSRKRKIFIYIILTVSFVLDIILCYLDRNTKAYEIGNSFYTNIFSIGFMIATLINGYYTIKHNKADVKKTNISYCGYIVAFIIIGIFQIICPNMPIMCFMTVFMVISMYSKRLRDLISIDPLTKLNNRNMLENYLKTLTNDVKARSFVLMLDLDSFKQINDNFGHLEGDKVLMSVSSVLKSNVSERNDAFLARYGGDEFIVILKNIIESDLLLFIESVNEGLKEIPFNHNVTVSCGYARMRLDETFEETLKRADSKMYEYKKA